VRKRPFATRGFVQLLLVALVLAGLVILLSHTGIGK